MGIFWTKSFWPSCHLSTFPDTLHEISHSQILLDVIYTVEFTSVVYGMGMFTYDPVSQRNIGCNDQIAFTAELDNMMIRFICPLVNNDVFYIF